MMMDRATCPWLDVGLKDVGLREVPGKATAPRIAGWLMSLKAWWLDDETPWCGVAVAAWMREANVTALPLHWYRARGWLDWGIALDRPVRGCVVVCERGASGHVGLVTGYDAAGKLLVLGGNQGNAVNVSAFETSRVLGYRWPYTLFVPKDPLPVTASIGAPSMGEA